MLRCALEITITASGYSASTPPIIARVIIHPGKLGLFWFWGTGQVSCLETGQLSRFGPRQRLGTAQQVGQRGQYLPGTAHLPASCTHPEMLGFCQAAGQQHSSWPSGHPFSGGILPGSPLSGGSMKASPCSLWRTGQLDSSCCVESAPFHVRRTKQAAK